MIRKLLCLLPLLPFLAACGVSRVTQRGPYKPKAFVTPYEYFSKTRPAVLTAQDEVRIEKTESTQNIGEDTKEDHTQAIIIGTLVGVSVVGGTVAGILLAR